MGRVVWCVVRQDQLSGGITRGGDQALPKKETGEKGVQKFHGTRFVERMERGGQPTLVLRQSYGGWNGVFRGGGIKRNYMKLLFAPFPQLTFEIT